VIPTLLVVGAVVGRWWAVPAAALGWVVLVSVAGDCGPDCWPAAAALGFLNTAVGVTLRKTLALAWRRV
jgi:hypothetical protein